MRIDATHKPWLWITTGAITAGSLLYAFSIMQATPAGGTPVGLLLGSIALGCMIFSALLSVRKRFRIIRVGPARIWMKAHLWLGFLALPFALLHGAFHARGLLTLVLLVLTVLVVGSGVWGAWLQHTLPTRMFRELPYETIYDQISVIQSQLLREAEQHAANVTQVLAPARGAGATVVLTMLTVPELGEEVAAFEEFYREKIVPYLSAERRAAARMPLHDRTDTAQEFDSVRILFPQAAWQPISALQEICEEKRQLDQQARLHAWLHAWLLVHLPLSFALLLLACTHAVVALRY